MQMSNRAKRMQRHQQRHGRGGMLSLVSLMDIFTILVFFLLVNSSEVEILPSASSLEMPESVADLKPRETVVVMITDETILVQGQPVASVAEVLASGDLIVVPLELALRAQADRVLSAERAANIAEREVTVMGDKALPYRLLKKVMATCTEADYGRISLAVMQRESTLAQNAP